MLEALRFGKKGDLARILTFHKISSNLSNVFYVMGVVNSRRDPFKNQFYHLFIRHQLSNARHQQERPNPEEVIYKPRWGEEEEKIAALPLRPGVTPE